MHLRPVLAGALRRNRFPTEAEGKTKRFTDERFRPKGGIRSNLRAGKKMNNLDQAGLSSPIAGLFIGGSGFFLGDEDIQAVMEFQSLKTRQAAKNTVDHDALTINRPARATSDQIKRRLVARDKLHKLVRQRQSRRRWVSRPSDPGAIIKDPRVAALPILPRYVLK